MIELCTRHVNRVLIVRRPQQQVCLFLYIQIRFKNELSQVVMLSGPS